MPHLSFIVGQVNPDHTSPVLYEWPLPLSFISGQKDARMLQSDDEMSKLKYTFLAVLVLMLLISGSGCFLPTWPFEEEDDSDITLDPPEYFTGHGESLVHYIPADFQGAVEEVRSAVVRIESTSVEEGWFLRPFPRETVGVGTGVIIDSNNGYIITNWHVVEDAESIRIRLYDGSELEATHYIAAINYGLDTDLALIKVRPSDIPDDLKNEFKNGKRYGKIRGLTIVFRNKKDIGYAEALIAIRIKI